MRSFWLLALGLSLPAMASVEQQLAHCAAINDKLDRLICYDTLAGQVSAAPQHQAIAPAAAATATVAPATTPVAPVSIPAPTNQDSFGKVKKSEEEPDRIELEVSSVKKDQLSNLIITFTNGQVWKQTESRNYKISVGEKLFIEKGALGAFYLGSESRNSTIRVKRVN